jgi:hypothetical protein
MLANQHVLVFLVRNLEEFHDDPVARAARMVPLILDCRRGADRVANENRLDESQAIVAVGHRARIDRARRHAHPDAEDQGAVGHATALSRQISKAIFGVELGRARR